MAIEKLPPVKNSHWEADYEQMDNEHLLLVQNLDDEMKLELFLRIVNKLTLTELENKLL